MVDPGGDSAADADAESDEDSMANSGSSLGGGNGKMPWIAPRAEDGVVEEPISSFAAAAGVEKIKSAVLLVGSARVGERERGKIRRGAAGRRVFMIVGGRPRIRAQLRRAQSSSKPHAQAAWW